MDTLLAILAAIKAFCGFGTAVATDVGSAQAESAGQAQQKVADQSVALNGEQAMDKAAAAPSTTEKDMDDGTF